MASPILFATLLGLCSHQDPEQREGPIDPLKFTMENKLRIQRWSVDFGLDDSLHNIKP
jgi:hypothetical protein